MLKLDPKFYSVQAFDDTEVVFEIVDSELEEKSSVFLDSKTKDETLDNTQSSVLLSHKSGYRPVEELTLKLAYRDLREKISRRSLSNLSLRSLLWVFKGLIGKQVLKNILNLSTRNSANLKGLLGNARQIKFDFELITVENKNEIFVEPQTSSNRILVLRKNKWSWLKNQSIRQVDRAPDCLFIILIRINNFDCYFINLDSRNLQANLNSIRESLSEKLYFTEVIGWIEGDDVQKLNDSEKHQPPGLSLTNPSYWCYKSDPILKGIHEFRRKYSPFV